MSDQQEEDHSHGQHWVTYQAFHGDPLGAASHGAGTAATQAVTAQQGTIYITYARGGGGGGGGGGNGSLNTYSSPAYAPAARYSTPEHSGIQAGEVIGWRVWRYVGGKLSSMAVSTLREPGVTMTGNVKYAGVHAFKTRSKLEREYFRLPGLVIGTVWLWGEVVEHTDGYRAEFARVRSIDAYRSAGWWGERGALRRLRQAYCPELEGLHERIGKDAKHYPTTSRSRMARPKWGLASHAGGGSSVGFLRNAG